MRKIIFCLLILSGIAIAPAHATTYYVAKNGVITNTGTKDSPWPTIGFAAGRTGPGDAVHVAAGLYDERISITKPGGANAFINYVADGQVICRGFDVVNVSYVRIIGFEITHTSSSFNDGIVISGACFHVEILDNYIHGVHATHGGIVCLTGTMLSYPKIRGNRIEDVGIVNGLPVDVPSVGISTIPVATDHPLIEYNTLKRVGDFIYMHGTNCIARNNALTQYTNDYWNITFSAHIDGFQDGSDGIAVGTRHHVYENNWEGESSSQDSHAGIWQDTVGAGDFDILIRGNVFYRVGAGGIAVYSADDFYTYNNTFSEDSYAVAASGNGNVFFARAFNSDVPDRGMIANTIFYDNGNRSGAINIADATNYTSTRNLGFLAGTDASYAVITDPLFVDKSSKNFRLQASSPAINAGAAVTTVTSANGSGTSFNVGNGQLFCDGFGIVDGDTITVGGTTTQISLISGNTIAVAASVTWTNGAPVYWGNTARADIGALPFGSKELTSASLEQQGTTYTVTPDGDTRGVWFYVDGIPTTWDATPPYTTTVASGVVTAKAYALYAQAKPVVIADPRPSNLRAQ